MIEGQLDGVVVSTGVRFRRSLEAKEPLDFIRFTPEQLGTLMGLMPELSASTLPRGSLSSLTELPDRRAFQLCHRPQDLPEELVYRAVKAVYDNHERLMRAHSAGRETFRPMSVAIPSCRFIPVRCGTIARSALPYPLYSCRQTERR